MAVSQTDHGQEQAGCSLRSHSMAWVEKDHRDHLVSTPLPAGSHAASGCVSHLS